MHVVFGIPGVKDSARSEDETPKVIIEDLHAITEQPPWALNELLSVM